LYSLGDLDGDGFFDISVGGGQDDDAGTNSGAVYILFLNPGSEEDAVKSFLKITPATSGLIGVAGTGQEMQTLSIVGDLDGDDRAEAVFGFNGGGNDAVVVARLGHLLPSASPSPSLTPSVSPNPSATPSVSPTPSVSSSPAAVGTVFDAVRMGSGLGGLPSGVISTTDRFGIHIAGIGDIDGDGIPDIAISADDQGSTSSGAVYIIFMNSDRTAKGFQKIHSEPEGSLGLALGELFRFGFSPTRLDQPSGDDGHLPRLVVGEPVSNQGTGRIWVLRLNVMGEVLHTQPIADGVGGLPSGTLTDSDGFGVVVSSHSGDLDRDGFNDVLVTATGNDKILGYRGALYVLFMQADDTVRTYTRISQAAGEGLDGLP